MGTGGGAECGDRGRSSHSAPPGGLNLGTGAGVVGDRLKVGVRGGAVRADLGRV